MSFLAKLKVDNIEYNVMEADYTITQEDDGTGQPVKKSAGGKISLKIESTKQTELLDWAISSSARKDGELILYNRDSVSTFRKIAFKDAFCLKYREAFNHNNTDPLFTELIIAAKVLDIKGSKFTNDWN
jgi:hypothetical protein